MIVVYIASAYTNGNQAENVRKQIEAYHELIDAGFCPIAPLLSHFAEIYKTVSYKRWLKIDFELIKRSDFVLRLPDEIGGFSKGADMEVKYALQVGMRVAYNITDLKLFIPQYEERKSLNAEVKESD